MLLAQVHESVRPKLFDLCLANSGRSGSEGNPKTINQFKCITIVIFMFRCILIRDYVKITQFRALKKQTIRSVSNNKYKNSKTSELHGETIAILFMIISPDINNPAVLDILAR